ncbi:MAG: DUF3604 domain-containing protein [Variovorax sp.]|nr:MAG: DUF3604 domain-containing protein [Variovorax sp.]
MEKLHVTCAALFTAGLLSLGSNPAHAQKTNPDRDAYFGDTHVHTSWSFDAYVFGNTLAGPEEAYKYALGQSVRHPGGYMVKLKRPLDFEGVTDHSEYVGAIVQANTPGSSISKLPIAEKLKVGGPADVQRVYLFLGESIIKNEPIKELISPDVAGTVWKEMVRIADKYNQPGKFTTFVAYEWTSTPDNRNMHRNVFFKDSRKVPELPFTSIDSDRPEDLWTWMDGQRRAGNEVLAISHNANLSDGAMFPVDVDSKGRPIDAAWAESRMRNEMLSEVQQLKGASETHPTLSPNDEFAGHEILTYLFGGVDRVPQIHGSYIREAYQNGLAMQATRGFDPYKFGLVGGSDTHNTVASYIQSNFFGGHGMVDATPKARLSGQATAEMTPERFSTAGLSGVWAESNTREALFNAMQRKETFGTSGVRIKVRMFGGWEFKPDVLKERNWAAVGYARGVPMGGDLPAANAKAPSFIVQALKDPDESNLDRIQIVKGWTRSGQTFEKIYDVAWSGSRKPDPATGRVGKVGDTVNIKNASYSNTIGAVELKTVWTDPEFDPSLPAFYYARVLQIPTPRWSTYDAKTLATVPPSGVPATVQERAWTSPIWFTPTAEDAKSAKPGGQTAADLKQKGAVALDDGALRELIVGKSVAVRNVVTGQRFEMLYGANGRRMITSIDGKQPLAGHVGDVMHSGELGSPAAYKIGGGRLVTTIGGTPFEVVVYKLGEQYLASRSNEFGFANYEVEPLKR